MKRLGHVRGTSLLIAILLGASRADAIAATYTTNFPLTENPISEGGRWIGGHTVGLDWADFRSTPGLAVGTQSGTNPGLYDDSIALLTGAWDPDQTVEATVRTVNQNDGIFEELEIRLRSTVAAHSSTGYECLFSARSSANAYAQIVRWNGPFADFTLLDGRGGTDVALHNGDTVKCSAHGNTITSFINGVQAVQVTDATYPTGSPGIGAYLQSGTGVNGDYGFTSVTAVTSGEVPIGGQTLTIKDRIATHTVRMTFASRDPGISGVSIDPTIDGATVQVFNSAGGTDSACFSLIAANWRRIHGGFKYLDKTLAASPVGSAQLKNGSLRFNAKDGGPTPISYGLDEPSQGSVAVVVSSGSEVLCADFGGTVSKDSGTNPPNAGGKGLFIAKGAPAPAACPVPPAVCP